MDRINKYLSKYKNNLEMSLSKFLAQQLGALTKSEFDKVVKLYLNEVYGYYRVVNTDGPNDHGNDIQVFDIHDQRNQYQVTVQKTKLSAKLEEDLEKARRNHLQYDFSSTLFFFYSLPISNKKINEYRKDALINYGIVLNIIEGNQIAEESADSYNTISKLIFQLNGINVEDHSDLFGKDDDRYKMLYDLITFGSPSDIKGTMVKSFILHSLLSTEELSAKEIFARITDHFKTEGNDTYCNNLIQKLRDERKIEMSNKTEKKYRLTEGEKNRLKTVIQSFNLSEVAFIKSVRDILSEYGIEDESKKVINRIKNLYDSNYNISIKELDSRSGDFSNFEKSTKKFKLYIESLLSGVETTELVAQLIEISENNDFLQKVCAGNFFTSVANNEKLERFSRLYKSKHVRIFLDTQILLRAICTHYRKNIKYDNYALTAAENLIQFANHRSLPLKTSFEYCKEVLNHIKNALNLIPFTKLREFQSLGGSNNVFFNYFKFLSDNNHIDQEINFEAFLKEFRITEDVNLVSMTKRLLRDINIEVVEFPKEYSNYSINEMFQNSQRSSFNRKKKDQAIRYDSMMVEFLGDDDVDINPIDPIFITWDHAFYKVRKRYFMEFPNCTKWFMFTPSKFIDYFSLLDFEISSESLSNQILSILDEDSDFVNQTQSLLDSIVSIINPTDEVGLRYTNKLNELRNYEIKRIDEKPKLPSGTLDVEEKPIVIDKIFFQMNGHFSKSRDTLMSYRNIFTNEKLIEEVLKIISNEIDYYSEKGKLSNSVIPQMTKLLSK
ncbi:hypothetical protein ACFLR8_01470 [Bacteroidota bacterium]